MVKPANSNLTWHQGEITYRDRAGNLNQPGLVIWFTGLSGSGKSTIAAAVEQELVKLGKAVYRLDGDNIRLGLNSDLGFSTAERDENIRRIAEVAALFKDAALITLVAFISPHRKMREFARAKIGSDSFIEVYVKADLETCIQRDPRGLYKKALRGEIPEFTGLASPYEEPLSPELTIDTNSVSPAEATRKVMDLLLKRI